MVSNKYNFISDGFKERSFRYQSTLEWFPIDITGQKVYPYKVTITDTITNDNYVPSSNKNQTYPSYEQQGMIPYYGKILGGIMIQMSPDKIEIQRTVYGVSDWLNEVGGFGQAVQFIFILIVPFLKFWTLEKYRQTMLYKKQT